MKLNRKNTKKRRPNTVQKIRYQKRFVHHQPKKVRKQKASNVGRIGKPSGKKRRVVILRRRRLSWKGIQVLFLLLFLVLILLGLYFRR